MKRLGMSLLVVACGVAADAQAQGVALPKAARSPVFESLDRIQVVAGEPDRRFWISGSGAYQLLSDHELVAEGELSEVELRTVEGWVKGLKLPRIPLGPLPPVLPENRAEVRITGSAALAGSATVFGEHPNTRLKYFLKRLNALAAALTRPDLPGPKERAACAGYLTSVHSLSFLEVGGWKYEIEPAEIATELARLPAGWVEFDAELDPPLSVIAVERTCRVRRVRSHQRSVVRGRFEPEGFQASDDDTALWAYGPGVRSLRSRFKEEEVSAVVYSNHAQRTVVGVKVRTNSALPFTGIRGEAFGSIPSGTELVLHRFWGVALAYDTAWNRKAGSIQLGTEPRSDLVSALGQD